MKSLKALSFAKLFRSDYNAQLPQNNMVNNMANNIVKLNSFKEFAKIIKIEYAYLCVHVNQVTYIARNYIINSP